MPKKSLTKAQIEQIYTAWDTLNGSMSLSDKRVLVADEVGCSTGTVRKYIDLRENDYQSLKRVKIVPKSVKIPATVQRVNACPKCRRLYLDTWSRAVVITHTRDNIAYMRCRGCKETFKRTYPKGF